MSGGAVNKLPEYHWALPELDASPKGSGAEPQPSETPAGGAAGDENFLRIKHAANDFKALFILILVSKMLKFVIN